MPQEVRISCIRRDTNSDPDRRIDRVGGANADGSRWSLPIEAAIKGIEDQKWKFFTRENNVTAWVYVAQTAGRTKYLTTEPDGKKPNNLLSLVECP